MPRRWVESSTAGSKGVDLDGMQLWMPGVSEERVEKAMSSRPGAEVSRRWLLRLGRAGLMGQMGFPVDVDVDDDGGWGIRATLATAASSNQVPVCDSAEMEMPVTGFRSVMPSPYIGSYLGMLGGGAGARGK